MFRLLRRLSSSVSGKSVKQPKMSPMRFFANPMPDYSGQESDSTVPKDYVKNFIDKITHDIEKNIKISDKNGRDGLYLGTAGIAYMFYHLSKVSELSQQKQNFLSKAMKFIEPALIVSQRSSSKDGASFILGSCGVFAVASAIYNAIGDKIQSEHYRKIYQEMANICKDMNFLNCGSDELFVGRAGYIFGALWLASETKTQFNQNDLYCLCNLMIESGRKYSQRCNSPCPLMYSYYQVEYLGAAHGLCTILQALLSVPGYLDSNPSHAKDVKSSIDYLMSLQGPEGNFPCAMDDIEGRNELVHWCHGAGGMIYLMAKAYLVFQERRYLTSCEKMSELIWNRGLLKKGPGICHGVAGNGYAFLLMFRLTEKPKYLYRAIAFARFMQNSDFVAKARTPDYPFSLYEGIAGTACYLGDLLCPAQAAFPFSDVFQQ